MKGLMLLILALVAGFLGYKWYAAGQTVQRLEWSITDVRANNESLDGEVKRLKSEEQVRLEKQLEKQKEQEEIKRKISALSQEMSEVEKECGEYRTKLEQYERIVEKQRQARAHQAEQQQASLDAIRAAREGRVLGEGETEAKRYVGKRGEFYFFLDGAGGWYVRKELKGWCDEAMKIVAARDREDAQKRERLDELKKRIQTGKELSASEQVELDKLQKREQGFEMRKKEAELKKEKMR